SRMSAGPSRSCAVSDWIGNIAMVVIGVGYLSYFFPILNCWRWWMFYSVTLRKVLSMSAWRRLLRQELLESQS
ncbi:hypothetical protein O5833_29430, partial [Escherichia coli]|nr:hypothetical protein [Escherichia coli]